MPVFWAREPWISRSVGGDPSAAFFKNNLYEGRNGAVVTSLYDLERAEVLRGPQSILYGTDAIGGVINIITRRGDGPGSLRSTSMGGSFGTARQSLTASGGDDCRHYSVSAFFLNTDGISSADENAGNEERDGYRNLTFSGRMGWTPSERLEIDYVFRYSDSEVEVDGFAQFPAIFNRPIDDAPLFDRRNNHQIFYNRLQVRNVALGGLIESKFGFNLTDYVRDDSRL